jgi:predicted nucleotidyltransferase
MRLADDEQLTISNAIHQADADARVYLFGSRVDDAAQGGDIDLLVLSKKINIMDKLSILAQLHIKLGERKIDIAIYPDMQHPFPRMVMATSVPL